MDPFIMRTVGEAWARDRQQRRHEREIGGRGRTIGAPSVVQSLYARLYSVARSRLARGMPERVPAHAEPRALRDEAEMAGSLR